MSKNKIKINNEKSVRIYTVRPGNTHSTFVWNKDVFSQIGYRSLNMSKAMSTLPLTLRSSLKEAILDFSSRNYYVPAVIISIFFSINASMKRNPTRSFDTKWVTHSLEVISFKNNIVGIRKFFLFWMARDANCITKEAIQILMKAKPNRKHPRNVLSDNPEKSWLTDTEYNALLTKIWHNYEDGFFSTNRTLMLLLSMQYARRPSQISQLKIKDFRIAGSDDKSGLSGTIVSFPGTKDMGAKTEFRDSKFEHHPLPEHLWNLFEIQRENTRSSFEQQLNIKLTADEIENLPVFVEPNTIKSAMFKLNNLLKIDWRNNLGHQLFHTSPQNVSEILAWRPNGHYDTPTPLSHRTNQPIVVNATRLRHTRARQLARKGVPLFILSFWMGHTSERSIRAYYNDPAEDARKLDQAMAPSLMPLAVAFAGNLIDNVAQASRQDDPKSCLEFSSNGELKNVGNCGKYSFCSTTSIPIPCYRCRHFEPLVTAPHGEVLIALKNRQEEENQLLRIGGARELLTPIDLSADIIAVQNCIDRCQSRKIELGLIQ